MVFSYTVYNGHEIKAPIFLFLGETFIGAVTLSVILELHQFKYKMIFLKYYNIE